MKLLKLKNALKLPKLIKCFFFRESEKFLDVALINFPYVAGSGILLSSLVSCVGGTVVLLENFSIQNCVKSIHNYKVRTKLN